MQWTRKGGRIVRPHFYKKARGYSKWGVERDVFGWVWIDLGPFVFTTSP